MSEHFKIRDGDDADVNFVLASWVESDRRSPLGRIAWRELGDTMARAGSRRWVQRMLAGSQLRVAHVPGEPDAILGWCAFRVPDDDAVLVHYVYVKSGRTPAESARRLGIGSALVAHFRGPVIYTHQPVVRGVRIPNGWTYDSYRRF